MTHRIIDVSSENTRLRVKHNQLMIIREDGNTNAIPIEDISMLLVNHPSITISQSVICKLAEQKVATLFCSTDQMPTALTLPLIGHNIHPARLNQQIAINKPLKKRLWQSIVKCKISRQGDVLTYFTGQDAGLYEMAKRVSSGDKKNLEAQAAQRYWPRLMGKSFRRNRQADDANILLNYGYTIIRSMVARSLCTTGLHPALGIFHHNRSNHFALADDMLEVWRPFIDRKVREQFSDFHSSQFNTEAKAQIISTLMETIQFDHQSFPLNLAIERMIVSLTKSFEEKENRLKLPEKNIFNQLI